MNHPWNLPKIGLRNIKTALSATLCAVLYIFVNRNPTFACIGAVFGMDNSIQASWRTGGNRLMGTVIGGFLGMGLFFLYLHLPLAGLWQKSAHVLLLFGGMVLLVYVSQLFRFPGAIQAGSVVFFIVMLNTPVNSYISYALNRMVDTAIGVLMSVTINMLVSRELLHRILPSHMDVDKEFPPKLDE